MCLRELVTRASPVFAKTGGELGAVVLANHAVRHSAATFTPFGYCGSGYDGLGESLQVGGRAVLQYVGDGRHASAGLFDTRPQRWIIRISPIYAARRS